MLKDIAGWLREVDCSVTVITAQPGYRPELVERYEPWVERIENGVTVYRVPLLPEKLGRLTRNLNYCLFTFWVVLLFPILSLAAIGHRRACLCSTIPPIVQPFLLMVLSKVTFCKLIYCVHDIYPDVRRAPGRGVSWLHRALTMLDCITLRNAHRVLVLSKDMQDTLQKRKCGIVRFQILNNFPLLDVPEEKVLSAIQKRRNSGTHNFIFAGNLGRYQGLQRLVRFFLTDAPDSATLTLLGTGALESELRAIVSASGSDKVIFRKLVPASQVPEILNEYDYGVASLSPEIINYAFPSKILTYWSSGLPILTTISPQSHLANQLENEQLGVTADLDDLSNAVSELMLNKEKFLDGVEKYRIENPLSQWRNEWVAIGQDIAQS